jgi:hypothetical protein
MFEIHLAVEELLGEPVSRSTVKNYLASGSTDRKTKLFERVCRGCYRLPLGIRANVGCPTLWPLWDSVRTPEMLGGNSTGYLAVDRRSHI